MNYQITPSEAKRYRREGMITTILTDEQRVSIEGECHARYAQGEKRLVRNAIDLTEQAVLQSEQVRAWKEDAERYRWLLGECYRWPKNGGLCNEYDQMEPVALWVKQEVGDDPCATIDATMEQKP